VCKYAYLKSGLSNRLAKDQGFAIVVVTHYGLNTSSAWWIKRTIGDENKLKYMPTQKIEIFNNALLLL